MKTNKQARKEKKKKEKSANNNKRMLMSQEWQYVTYDRRWHKSAIVMCRMTQNELCGTVNDRQFYKTNCSARVINYNTDMLCNSGVTNHIILLW